MVTEKETAVAKEYLKGTTIKGIWVNSAGELFSVEHLAKLSDEDAEFVRNSKIKEASEQITKEADADKKGADTDPSKETADADKKAENLKLLAETDLTKENYTTMATLVKAFDLQTTGKSADVYIEALTKFKETLKPV